MADLKKAVVPSIILALAGAVFAADAEKPVVGKSPRYCNPLPMVMGQGGSASGDVSVIKEGNTYYMYCTGGGAWISEDLLNWTFQRVANVPVAPDVVKYKNAFYMSGNDGPLFKADNPLGPFASLGPWKNTGEMKDGWNDAFDTHIYIDNGKPYLFFPGRSTSGIYVVPLDPDDLTRFLEKPTHLIGFNPRNTWERYGEMNEYSSVAWIEGPWLTKRDGIYYLQYSASGTQWKTYAQGYYTSKNIMGPYTYAPNNPLLRKTEGLVTGTAHGSIVEGPDGTLWQFYTIVLSNPPGGRRIGMDPVIFDKDGNMSVKVTDTPQWAPGVFKDLKDNDSGSLPITINKIRAMNNASRVSSQNPGRDGAYATDNSSGTWWEPAADDAQPSLTIDLSPATRFDKVEYFTVDSVRLMFTGGGGFGGARGGMRGGAAGATALPAAGSPAYQYKIEVSDNGVDWKLALDATNNITVRNTIFNEFQPVVARFVKLTLTNWPRTTPLGVIEFTAFGKPHHAEPAAVPIPTPPTR